MHRFTVFLLTIAPFVWGSPTASRNTSAGCSKTSFGNLKWTVEKFDFRASYIFTTPAHQNSWGYANFNLSNNALPDVLATCSAQSDQLSDFFYGDLPYTCTIDGEPGPAPARFTFSRPSGELDINQTWTCDDVDPNDP